MIEDIVSVIYQIKGIDQPTFDSLGVAPDGLMLFYQRLLDQPLTLPEDIQFQQEVRRLFEADMVQSTHEVGITTATHPPDTGQGDNGPWIPSDTPQETAPAQPSRDGGGELSVVPVVPDVTGGREVQVVTRPDARMGEAT